MSWGEVGYLTVHESVVREDGQSQRRGGVHTETPGRVWLNAEDNSLASGVAGELAMMTSVPLTVAWGRGQYIEFSGDGDGGEASGATTGATFEYKGGLYMASNVANSTRVWGDTQIVRPEHVVGPLGDLESLRHYLGEGCTLDAGEIVWMTDTTPHESLPLPAGTRRQYFRLVTNHVSAWFADHSTKNPLGIVPDPDLTTIVHGDKFAAARGDADAAAAAAAAAAARPDSGKGEVDSSE